MERSLVAVRANVKQWCLSLVESLRDSLLESLMDVFVLGFVRVLASFCVPAGSPKYEYELCSR